MAEPDGLDEALRAASAEIGAARMAAVVAAIMGGPVHPDVIAGVERLTGERYDPDTGTWARPPP
jgi:hypothetical protein